MRRFTIAATGAVLLVAMASPANAESVRSPVRVAARAPLADLDRNGISDGLQRSLADAEPSDVFRVSATFTRPTTPAEIRRAIGDFTLHARLRLANGLSATMRASQIRALARRPGSFRIQEEVTYGATMDAAQADFGTALARADFGVSGAGAAICVADTGADPNHEQLDGAKIVGWQDFIGGKATPYDDHGHGTHVLSIAAGDGTGGSIAGRFRGVAPGAPAYVAKVLDAQGYSVGTSVEAGVQWCANQPDVRVISMSLGTLEASDGSDTLSVAVNNAVTVKGKIVVVAAGNSGDAPRTVGSPGAAVQALTVGAVAEHSADPASFWHSDGIYLTSFSSRGPTVDGRTKPDVVAPGHTILAADSGTSATYVGMSGTSMATPFVAGTLALAAERDPGLTPAEARALVTSTAVDRGAAGQDNEWGYGLLDGYAVVAAAGGAQGQTQFPAMSTVTGSVSDNGLWRHTFTVASDALDDPIAATIVLNGQLICVWDFGPWGCAAYEWSPDLDARLIDPGGTVVAQSTCAAGDECTYGRQETLHAMPTTAGTYAVEVFPFSGEPNNGRGGSFTMDLSRGPVGDVPPPPPVNAVPVAAGDAYETVEGTALVVGAPGVLGNDTDGDGDALTATIASGPSHGGLTLNPNGSLTYTPAAGYVGNDSFTYRASDGTANSAPATVTIAVTRSLHVADLDGARAAAKKGGWTATVTVKVHTGSHALASGVLVQGSWSTGASGSCTTSRKGTCSMSLKLTSATTSVTFTLNALDGGPPAASDADPDGDSTGSTITIARP